MGGNLVISPGACVGYTDNSILESHSVVYEKEISSMGDLQACQPSDMTDISGATE